jgi:uncharacterized Rmd1/YagE family protein
MITNYSVVAIQIAISLNIRKCKTLISSFEIIYADSDEIFLKTDRDKFVYIFQYGVLSFFNFNPQETNNFIRILEPEAPLWGSHELNETFKIKIRQNTQKVEFDSVTLSELNPELIRLVMLNTSQSVALEKYLEITDAILIETRQYVKELELRGSLSLSPKKLKMFIGRVLNVKNQIFENLYIFNAPDITWENESLNKLNNELKQIFDLKDRYQYIYERNSIIKEELDLFKNILDQSESKRLEIIIIALILVEVIDLFIIRIF